LDSRKFESKTCRHRAGKERLGKPWHSGNQAVTVRQQTREDKIDSVILPHNYAMDLVPHLFQFALGIHSSSYFMSR
jgi:hypothetical protein